MIFRLTLRRFRFRLFPFWAFTWCSNRFLYITHLKHRVKSARWYYYLIRPKMDVMLEGWCCPKKCIRAKNYREHLTNFDRVSKLSLKSAEKDKLHPLWNMGKYCFVQRNNAHRNCSHFFFVNGSLIARRIWIRFLMCGIHSHFRPFDTLLLNSKSIKSSE